MTDRLVGEPGAAPAEFVVRGAVVIDRDGRRRADVAVRDGVVVAVGDELDGGTVLDASGCILTPGLVDLNAGVGQPGHEETETVRTAARAAALGGFTTIVARPDTDPVVDCAAVAKEVLLLGADAACRVLPAATVTVGAGGERLVPMAELAELGVRLFADDGVGIADGRLLRRALEYAAPLGVVIVQFAQDPSLAAGGHMNEGAWSSRLGIGGVPAEAEEVVVMRDLALARLTGGRLHFRTLSTAASWAMVAGARRRGLPVSAEASIHHLLLTDEACSSFDPATKFRPPLRTTEDRAAIVAAVAAGDVDALVSDHTPHSIEDKEVPFDEAAPGASSLQWLLAVALSELTLADASEGGAGRTGPVGLAELIAALSWRPRAILTGMPDAGGRIEPGAVADLTVIDPTATWTLDPLAGASRTRTTPFAGRTLRGRVRHTIVGGVPVVLDAVAQR
jgi:dihydroorotase